MIRIKQILNEDVIFELETDFYNPIKIEFPSNDIPIEEMYYYRIFNKKYSFLEIF